MKFIGFIIIIFFLIFIIYKIDINIEKIDSLNNKVSEINIMNKSYNNDKEVLFHINNAEKYINNGDKKKAISELEEIKKITNNSNIDEKDIYDNIKDNINDLIKDKIIEKLSK